LDVREIFAQISAEARRIVPHDFLLLGLVTEDRQRVRVTALSGELADSPEEVPFPDALRFVMEQDAFALNEMRATTGGGPFTGWLRRGGGEAREPIEVERQPLFDQLVVVRGFRSFLRATVSLRGGLLGGLIFCSTAPDAFSPDDAARARQI